MADAPSPPPADASRAPKRAALSPLRIALFLVLIAAAVALLFDLRSRNAAREAFGKVSPQFNGPPDEVAKLIGRPADEELVKGSGKVYVWRWPGGIFNSYSVRAYFGDENPPQMRQITLNEPPLPKPEPAPKKQ